MIRVVLHKTGRRRGVGENSSSHECMTPFHFVKTLRKREDHSQNGPVGLNHYVPDSTSSVVNTLSFPTLPEQIDVYSV